MLNSFFVEYHLELEDGASPYRDILEKLLPAVASELKLEKNWSYQELYLAMLEASAKLLRVQKYKIYTEKELFEEIQRKWEGLEKKEELPDFVEYMLSTW